MINPKEVIDSFKKLDSLDNTAKEKLTKLYENMRYIAPELIIERLFYDFNGHPGLISILDEFAYDNQEAIKLYQNVLKQVNEEN